MLFYVLCSGQLSQAVIHMAGLDPGEADSLRKVVTKKNRKKKLRDFYTRFVKGPREREVGPEVIDAVWRMIMGFDGSSFCKSHSASYTLVTYKSAYLRAHYPAEFMASIISNGGGYYSAVGYISEARRMGLEILPPDINLSEIKYTGNDKTVRVGFFLSVHPLDRCEGILKRKVEETFGAVNLGVDRIGFLDRYKAATPHLQKRTSRH